jgi:hypothetical protein
MQSADALGSFGKDAEMAVLALEKAAASPDAQLSADATRALSTIVSPR